MKDGDVVVCTGSRGYNFTPGKEYVVLKYDPEVRDSTYTWPAYVRVVDDGGKVVVCHASRFKSMD